MIRKPADDPKQWWRDALAGLKPAITADPMPGYYRRKLVKGGPYVPVSVWIEEDRDPETGDLVDDVRVMCSVNGRMANADDHWMYCCDQPIDEKTFDYLSSLSKYAKKHNKREPLANPRRPIDPLRFPLPTLKPSKPKRNKS